MVDEVYVMKSGKLAEHGSYETLLGHNGEFSEFVREFFLNGTIEFAISWAKTCNSLNEAGLQLNANKIQLIFCQECHYQIVYIHTKLYWSTYIIIWELVCLWAWEFSSLYVMLIKFIS